MAEFFLGCALGCVFVVCLAAPFAAPWRMRVRFIVASQVPDPVFGFAPPRDIALSAVKATRVEAEQGDVLLVVEEDGAARPPRRRVLARASCAPALVAKLDGWTATHESLLMVVDEVGDTHLYGPDGAVTHLDRVEERTR